MTIGRNFGFFRNKHMGYGEPTDYPAFNISVAYSGASKPSVRDTNIITYTITSNVKNTTIYYTIEDLIGNLQANDFADNTLTGTINLDANGGATVTKTLVKSIAGSEGHKQFKLRLRRNSITGFTLKDSANTQVYELIPITASGGNTAVIPYVAPEGAANWNQLQAAKYHSFSNAATETFTISDYGNYTGNANVWIDQFVTAENSYWDNHPISAEKGLRFRCLIVGGGGPGTNNVSTGGVIRTTNAGGGAGEMGFWSLPLGNIAAGSYSMKVGQGLIGQNTGISSNAANTIAFVGNVTLQITAIGGGTGVIGGGSTGGCGGGGTSSGGSTAISAGLSQLPTKTSIYYPTSGLGAGRTSGGGGVLSPGNLNTSNGGDGWKGSDATLGWAIDPQWAGSFTDVVNSYGGGGGGSNNGAAGQGGGGSPGIPPTKGTGGGGGSATNGATGLIAIRYPYAPAYRFATANVLV